MVTLILQGACSGCPSSNITLKNGIETLLKQKIGSKKIKKVIASNENKLWVKYSKNVAILS